MAGRLAPYGVFFREFRRNFRATGAICPSGRWLSAALCCQLDDRGSARRILEVGPGTGAVTAHIVRRMQEDDRLDLVELNPRFVEQLRRRLADEPDFQAVAPRTRIFCQPVEAIEDQEGHDTIISGLPLNNFEVAEVRQVLDALRRLAKPGGTLSFFEYIGVRPLRGLVSRGVQRDRLRGIGQAIGELLEQGEFRRDRVWFNAPPAWVHHVRFPPAG